MDKFNIIIIIMLILIFLGEGFYGGYKSSKIGVECNIGLMKGKFCWVWKTELKQEVVAGEKGGKEFYEKQGYFVGEKETIETSSCPCNR